MTQATTRRRPRRLLTVAASEASVPPRVRKSVVMEYEDIVGGEGEKIETTTTEERKRGREGERGPRKGESARKKVIVEREEEPVVTVVDDGVDSSPLPSTLISSFLLLARGALADDIFVSFDGASRGRVERNASCGAVMFLLDKACVVRSALTAGEKLGMKTNNQAEILGLCEALRMIQKLCDAQKKDMKRCSFHVRGDSQYVIEAMKSSRLATLTVTRSDQTNWNEWNVVRSLLTSLPPQVGLVYEWIPRDLNAAADKVANNALDGVEEGQMEFVMAHPPAFAVQSITEEGLRRFWTGSRRPTCKFLASHMLTSWRRVFFGVLSTALQKPESVEAWAAVVLSPILYLFPQPKAQQKSFLFHNTNPVEAEATCRKTLFSPPMSRTPTAHVDRTVEEEIESCFRGGSITRATDLLLGKKVTPQPPTSAKATKYWPHRDDCHAFAGEMVYDVRFDEILAHTRRLSSRKGADLQGWTKELFLPIVANAEPLEKRMLEEMFVRLINGQVPAQITEMIRTDLAMFIGNEKKDRPVTNCSLFAKVMWKIALARASEYFPPQNIIGTTSFLQADIVAGAEYCKLDGANAFFNLSRRLVHESLEGVNCPMVKRLWNVFYATPSSVLMFAADGTLALERQVFTGVKAGCPSAAKLFNRALHPFLSRIQFNGVPLWTCAIVDDIMVRRPPDMPKEELLQSVANTMRHTMVNFMGPKTKWIDLATPPFKNLGAILAPVPTLPLEEVFTTVQQPIFDALDKLQALKIRLHMKYHLLRQLQLRLKYMYRATHLRQAETFASRADERIKQCFLSFTSLRELDPRSFPLIHLPVEEGGMGLAQLTPLTRLFWNKRVMALRVYLDVNGFGTGEPRYKAFESSRKDAPTGDMGESAAIMREWKQTIQDSPFLRSLTGMKHVRQAHLLNAEPIDPLLLTDAQFNALVWNRLQFLPKTVVLPCKFTGHRYDHVTECPLCKQGTVRHNDVLYEMARSIRKLGVVVAVNPPDMPLVKQAVAVDDEQPTPAVGSTPAAHESFVAPPVVGPDLMVWTHPQRECIDLFVTTPVVSKDAGRLVARDAMNRAYMTKRRTYKLWEETYKLQCHPFVMSTNGFFEPHTVQLMEKYAKDGAANWFVPAFQLALQKRLCSIMAEIFDAGRVRALGRSQQQ